MAVVINYTPDVTNLKSYQAQWTAAYEYNFHGFFAGPGVNNSYSQWGAGDLSNSSESGVLLTGDFSYVQPGGFSGTLTSLEFGDNLNGNSSGYSIDAELTFDLSGAASTTLFAYAIYQLSNSGSWTTLNQYLGEQGTVQTGNAGINDTLYGFAGADTFVFQANSGLDTIRDFDHTQDVIDISAWGVTDMSELTFFGDGGASILIIGDGVAIDVVGTSTLSASNFIFASSALAEAA